MTELERARAHLRGCQRILAFHRTNGSISPISVYEDPVLAALSWVWEAQQRELMPDSAAIFIVSTSNELKFKGVGVGDFPRHAFA
jgi:hypothetical protein